LHLKPFHPLTLIREGLEKSFESLGLSFEVYKDLDPVVTVEDNFDQLLFSKGDFFI
jgi:phenylalanyl-tRNA synthetase alpha subunit